MMLENIHGDLAMKYEPEPVGIWPSACPPGPVDSQRFLRPPPLRIYRQVPSPISYDGFSVMTSVRHFLQGIHPQTNWFID